MLNKDRRSFYRARGKNGLKNVKIGFMLWAKLQPRGVGGRDSCVSGMGKDLHIDRVLCHGCCCGGLRDFLRWSSFVQLQEQTSLS
jgi:hypothetical protein